VQAAAPVQLDLFSLLACQVSLLACGGCLGVLASPDGLQPSGLCILVIA